MWGNGVPRRGQPIRHRPPDVALLLVLALSGPNLPVATSSRLAVGTSCYAFVIRQFAQDFFSSHSIILAEDGTSRSHVLWPVRLLFVRDGIHSVADYNSTLMGVVVVVVVVVVVRFFHDGIIRERLELSS